MKYTLLILFLILMFLLSVTDGLQAQQTIVKGIVQDKESGEPVELANIQIMETSQGAVSDDKGYFFILDPDPGAYTLNVFRMGYESIMQTIIIKENQSVTLSFALTKTTYELDEVAISAARTKARTQIKVSEVEVLPTDITRVPSFGSLPDIAQHLQTLPGVISTGDAGGQIYIRGGSPVQNKTLMDGAVIYNPFHSSGLYSVFDLDAIRKAEVHTGGFGAEYSGALSSVIDVTTRYGNIQRYSGKVDVSTLGSKLLLEGPVFKPKSDRKSNASFLAYYKTSYFDKAANSIYSYVDQDLPFSFHDLYGKFSLFSKDVFKANLYGFSFNDKSGSGNAAFEHQWKNQGFGANFYILPPLNSTLIHGFLAVSGFHMQLDEKNYVPRESKVNSVNFGMRINTYFGNHYMKYGFEVLTLKTEYLYYSTDFNQTEQYNNSSEITGYTSFFGNYNKLLINPGIRLIIYSALNKLAIEPRLSLKYLVSDHVRLKIAGGIYSQNLISAASDRDIVNFFMGYLSAPVNVASQTQKSSSDYILQNAYHIIIGGELELGERVFVNIEAYYKGFPQLINYNRDKLFNENDNPDQPQILTRDFIVEEGDALGLETTLKFTSNRVNASLIYSLSKTTRTYDDKKGEEITYYPHFDRRHNLNLMGSLYLSHNKSWELNVRWNLGTGFPYTPSKGYYESNTIDPLQIENELTQNGTLDIQYGTYNGSRLPLYHRLDISIKKSYIFGSHAKLEVELNAINVYNRKNIYYVDRANNKIVYQLPFLPGIRVGFTF